MSSSNEKRVPAAYDVRQRQLLDKIARSYQRLQEKLDEFEAKLQQSGLSPDEKPVRPNKPR